MLRLSLDADGLSIPSTPVCAAPWDASRYAGRFGMLRGGTPPMLIDNVYCTFFHSMYPLPRWRRFINRLCYGRGVRTRRYAIGFYGFSADYPFQPVCFSPVPLFPAPPRQGPPDRQLNRAADRVIYPSGAVYDSGEWLLSFGLHDECCCLARFTHDELLRKTIPVKSAVSG